MGRHIAPFGALAHFLSKITGCADTPAKSGPISAQRTFYASGGFIHDRPLPAPVLMERETTVPRAVWDKVTRNVLPDGRELDERYLEIVKRFTPQDAREFEALYMGTWEPHDERCTCRGCEMYRRKIEDRQP